MRNCNQCGYMLPDNATDCPNCGKHFYAVANSYSTFSQGSGKIFSDHEDDIAYNYTYKEESGGIMKYVFAVVIAIVAILAIYTVGIKDRYCENLDAAKDNMIPFVNSCIGCINNGTDLLDEDAAYEYKEAVDSYYKKLKLGNLVDKDMHKHALELKEVYDDLFYVVYESDDMDYTTYIDRICDDIRDFKREGRYVGLVELDG